VTVSGGARSRTFGLLAMSTSAHLIVFTALGLIPGPAQVLAMHESEFEVVENKPPPEPEPVKPPDPEPEPPPEPVKAPRHAAAPAPTPPPAADTPPPQAAEEVADFTGVTLTADGSGSSWSTAVGTGGALKGPVGKIGRPGPKVEQSAKVAAPGPRVVPVGSLARPLKAPAGLDQILQRNYPRRAQAQGVEGKVVVRLHVLPSGRVGNIAVVREFPTGYEFAEACRETVRQSPAFEPPLDRDGTPVATDINFSCEFIVSY
jgi:TonB family protein